MGAKFVNFNLNPNYCPDFNYLIIGNKLTDPYKLKSSGDLKNNRMEESSTNNHEQEFDEEIHKILGSENGWEKLHKLHKDALDEIHRHDNFIHKMIYTLSILIGFLLIIYSSADINIRLFGLELKQLSIVANILLPAISAAYYLLISRIFQEGYVSQLDHRITKALYPEIKNERFIVGLHPSHTLKAERILNRYFNDYGSTVKINSALAIIAMTIIALPVALIALGIPAILWRYGSLGLITWIGAAITTLFLIQSMVVMYYKQKMDK